MRLRTRVKWIEPRREHVTTAAHAREQWHDIELAARRDGTIVAMRAELLADMGAYTRSLGVLCPSITAASLPGPYRIRHYTCRVRCALTCKAPAAAYRGAGQPEAVFAIERAVDHLAEALEMDPAEIRRRNFIGRDEFPWDVGTASAQIPVIYDSGDYGAGRNAVMAGNAALGAARAVAAKARRMAARLLEADEGDIVLTDGGARVVGAPDRQVSLGMLASACSPGSPLPEGMEPGLEAMHYFQAPRATF